jgi:hypothetical protein
VRVLLLIGIVVMVLALYAADRLRKARSQLRRLREMSDRLTAATVRGEEQHEQRQTAKQASQALTSFMPAIQRPPSDLPGVSPPGAARPRAGRDRSGPRDHDPGHAGRRGPRSGEHKARSADRSPHGEAARACQQPDSRPAG